MGVGIGVCVDVANGVLVDVALKVGVIVNVALGEAVEVTVGDNGNTSIELLHPANTLLMNARMIKEKALLIDMYARSLDIEVTNIPHVSYPSRGMIRG